MTTLISAPTKTASIGIFKDVSNLDIFQVLGPDGAVKVHMNSDGVIDPPVFPIITKVTLSAAQLNGMHTSAPIVIPAPGAGLYLLPQSITAAYNFGGTPFTVTGGDQFMYFGWQEQALSTAAAIATLPDAGLVDQSSSQVFISTSFMNTPVSLSAVINKPLVLGINDTLSGGNGTLTLVISYTVTAA